MAKKDKTWIVILILIVVLIYGGTQGWFKFITNNYSVGNINTPNQNTQTNYYCCNALGQEGCNLDGCPIGNKVYPDPFNSLASCNAKCITPEIIQPPVDQSLTCAQKATSLNALFYINPVSTAKECMDFAILDCQDAGKILDGYGVSGTCCYYTCIGIVIPPPVICSNTDSGLSYPFNLQTIGACTDGNGYFEDNCDGGMLREYYCEPGLNGGAAMCGYTSYNCAGVIPGTTCQNGKCM